MRVVHVFVVVNLHYYVFRCWLCQRREYFKIHSPFSRVLRLPDAGLHAFQDPFHDEHVAVTERNATTNKHRVPDRAARITNRVAEPPQRTSSFIVGASVAISIAVTVANAIAVGNANTKNAVNVSDASGAAQKEMDISSLSAWYVSVCVYVCTCV